jgi:ATP-dependent Lhr-like helicase
LPPGLPHALLESVAEPLIDLVSRFARTHGPFHAADVAERLHVDASLVRQALLRLAAQGRVREGEFLPGDRGDQWCDTNVLRTLKRRCLATLRRKIEPADIPTWGGFLARWQGLDGPRCGLDGLLEVVQQLQGVALPASDLERRILPVRVENFQPHDLDELCAAGEVVWQGRESLGPSDGKIALYLTGHAHLLAWDGTAPSDAFETDTLAKAIVELLARLGASFFDQLHRETGGFRNDLRAALWRLVWAGAVTNDTLAPLRSLATANLPRGAGPRAGRGTPSRRTTALPGTEGRWSLLRRRDAPAVTVTQRQAALATQLLERYGIVTRELAASESPAGGFAGLYGVFRAMEEAGRVRRGYFVAGQGAAQFATPGAEDQLRIPPRAIRGTESAILILAATDPANPYGAALRWPRTAGAARPQRTAGALVIVHQGHLLGYLGKTGRHLLTFLPEDGPQRQPACQALLEALSRLAEPGAPVLLASIDGVEVAASPLAPALRQTGFVPLSRGYRLRHADASSGEREDAGGDLPRRC